MKKWTIDNNYKLLEIIENGGVGSGIRGHTTPDNKKEKYRTTPQKIKEKQSKVNIDFSKDNYLPELNKEDLERLGKESKPVLLKKNIINRNKAVHPELKEEEYNLLISKALYEPNYVFSGATQGYIHFVAKIADKNNSAVLLDMKEANKSYDLVHIHKIRDRSLQKMKERDEK